MFDFAFICLCNVRFATIKILCSRIDTLTVSLAESRNEVDRKSNEAFASEENWEKVNMNLFMRYQEDIKKSLNLNFR